MESDPAPLPLPARTTSPSPPAGAGYGREDIGQVRRGAEEFVRALAELDPTPAGGAAAAASVAQGIGLFLKVIRITGRGNGHPRLHAGEQQLRPLMMSALDALEADCNRFVRVLEATRSGDALAIEQAWIGATECPLELVSTAAEALTAFAPLRARIKRTLALDAEAGVTLIQAGVSISLANARGNLAKLHSATEQERVRRRLESRGEAARAALARYGGRLT